MCKVINKIETIKLLEETQNIFISQCLFNLKVSCFEVKPCFDNYGPLCLVLI